MFSTNVTSGRRIHLSASNDQQLMINPVNGIFPQEFSRQHCNKGELDCGWYHGNWHLLKSLGLVSTSAIHEDSLNRLIKLAAADMTEPRILLTGSTDETLIRITHSACQAMGVNEKLSAVDICATPLGFMQAYASENQIELATFQSDILEFNTEQKFDIILTHAFMGYFNDVQRTLLVKKWSLLLSDQGRIITIQRIRPADSPLIVKFTPQQSAQFVSSALDAARLAGFNACEQDAVELAASEFSCKFVNYAITSKTVLESLFINNGLDFQVLEYHNLKKKGELSGPSVPSNAEFAHIVAKKSEVVHGT